MKASGAKSVLIQRLIEDADEHRVRQLFPNPVYALTEKGAELLRANQSVLADMWIDCEKAIEQGKNVAPEFKKPDTKKAKKKLTLQRARYPERRKEDGAFLIEKDCPSCGANFIPDANHCCSFCGYGLQVDNAKWVAAATEE